MQKVKDFNQSMKEASSKSVIFVLKIMIPILAFFVPAFIGLDNFEGAFGHIFYIITWACVILSSYWIVQGLEKIKDECDLGEEVDENEEIKDNKFLFLIGVTAFLLFVQIMVSGEKERTTELIVSNSEESGVEECTLEEYTEHYGEYSERVYDLNCY